MSSAQVRLCEATTFFGLVANDGRSSRDRPKSTTALRHLAFGASMLPPVLRSERAGGSHDVVTRPGAELANNRGSLVLSSGGGGNRTAGSSPDSDDSRTVSRTGIDQNTSKEHEQNALPDILMTMSQIPDVNRELAELGAMFSVFDALRRGR